MEEFPNDHIVVCVDGGHMAESLVTEAIIEHYAKPYLGADKS